MATSRSALEYMRRHGMRPTPPSPLPRLDLTDLLVHKLPRERTRQVAELMLADGLGNPSPDRGQLDLWPPEQYTGTRLVSPD